ncbi:MAG: hypothetical protein LRS46_02400, partial [Desulfurococcales archaeon]|nr:hypothetical protein [Desulfurococcales archaeon]
YVISKTIKRVKQAIREGRLWELLEEAARRHPAAHKALLTLRHGYSYLLTHSPRYKPRVKGLRLYSSESLWNPKIMLYKKRLYSSFLPKLLERLARDGVKEILARPFPSNIDECTKTKNLRDNRYNRYYIYYKPYIGLVPEDLCGVYPTTHSDYSSVNSSVLKVLASEIYLLVALTRRKEMRVEIEVPRNLGRLCILLRNLRGENLQVRCE